MRTAAYSSLALGIFGMVSPLIGTLVMERELQGYGTQDSYFVVANYPFWYSGICAALICTGVFLGWRSRRPITSKEVK